MLADCISHAERKRHLWLRYRFDAVSRHFSSSSLACIAAAIWRDGIPLAQLIRLQHCAVREAAQIAWRL
jgi:hypothetical protein